MEELHYDSSDVAMEELEKNSDAAASALEEYGGALDDPLQVLWWMACVLGQDIDRSL